MRAKNLQCFQNVPLIFFENCIKYNNNNNNSQKTTTTVIIKKRIGIGYSMPIRFLINNVVVNFLKFLFELQLKIFCAILSSVLQEVKR